jgi:DNA-directed RNA polymerase specialized sigma24 family protein
MPEGDATEPLSATSAEKDRAIFDLLEVDFSAGLVILLQHHGANVEQAIRNRFGSRLDPSEVIREAIVKRSRKAFAGLRASYQSAGPRRWPLGLWLFILASRTAQDMLRREHRRGGGRDVSLTIDPPCPERRREGGEVAEHIRLFYEAVEALPPTKRDLILADVASGWGTADTDRLMDETGAKENTIFSLRSQARKLIRDYMLKKGFDPKKPRFSS